MASSSDKEQRWQVGKDLVQCLSHMLDNEIGCDVTFRITSPHSPEGAKTRISGHKFMLRARSPVFEAMFSGAYTESAQAVEICDIEHDSFKEMLRYIYSDKLTLTGANVLNILYAAKKYILQGLIDECQRFLEEKMSTENVCHIFHQSIIYEEQPLVTKCLDFIGPKTNEVIKTDGFNDMSKEALHKFLECDWLCPSREVELYKASVEWAKRKAENPDDEQIRVLLGDCLHQIRFISMTPEEFAKTVGVLDVLTSEEKSSMFCLFHAGDDKHADKLRHIGFNLTSRSLRCARYTTNNHTSYSMPATGQPETVSFSADKPVYFDGCSVFLGPTGSNHDVKFSLENESSGEKVIETTSSVTSDGSAQGTPVYVKQSVRLEANIKYKFIGVIQTGPHTGYGENAQTSANVGGVQLQMQTTSWPFTETGQYNQHLFDQMQQVQYNPWREGDQYQYQYQAIQRGCFPAFIIKETV